MKWLSPIISNLCLQTRRYKRNDILRPGVQTQGQLSKQSLNGATGRPPAKLGALVGRADISSWQEAEQDSWCLAGVLFMSIVDASLRKAGVGRTWTASQIFALSQWKQMFSECSRHKSRCAALGSSAQSVICYQVGTDWLKYLYWNVFTQSNSEVLFPACCSLYGWTELICDWFQFRFWNNT